MNCPTCGMACKESDRECDCGELLAPWRTIHWSGTTLRQRGLRLAAQQDYLGACLAFTEAALANPLDQHSFVDAAKSLARLGRGDDAQRWLDHASSLWPESNAARVRDALLSQIAAAATHQAANETEPPAAAPPEQANDRAAPAATPPPALRPLLALEPLRRKAGWLGNWLGSDELDSTWSVVLRMEQRWNGNWRELIDWSQQAASLSDHPSVFHYVAGMGAWQADDRVQAAASFERCLMHSPPVLNAAAYFLCLYLDEPAAAKRAWKLLCDRHETEAVISIVQPLRQRLEQWQARDLLNGLDTVAAAAES